MRNNTSQENLRCEEIFDQKIQEVSQKKRGCRNPTEKTMGRQFEGFPLKKKKKHPPTHPGGEAGALLNNALFPGQALDKLKPGRCCSGKEQNNRAHLFT